MDIDHEIRLFARDLSRSRRKHRRQEVILVSLAILLSGAVTVVGLFIKPNGNLHPWISSVLGVCLSTVLSIDRAFAFGERAVYSRILQAEAENLADDGTLTPEERRKQFAQLRVRRAQSRLGEGLTGLEATDRKTEGLAP
jgi:hypothetical protein